MSDVWDFDRRASSRILADYWKFLIYRNKLSGIESILIMSDSN